MILNYLHSSKEINQQRHLAMLVFSFIQTISMQFAIFSVLLFLQFNKYCNLFTGKLFQNKNFDKFSSMKRAQNRRCIALRDQVTEIH